MDCWTYPRPNVDPHDRQPAHRDDDWRESRGPRIRTQKAETASVAELELASVRHAVGDLRLDSYIPFPVATSPDAALPF